MEGQAIVSPDVLARYAADAAAEVAGVRRVVAGHIRRQPSVQVAAGENGVTVSVPLVVEYGASIPAIGREVQRRVRHYLKVMADVDPAVVEVVIAAVETKGS